MKKISYTLITGAAGLLGKYHAIGILNLKQNLVLTDTDLVSLKKTQIFLKKKFPSSKILLKKLDVTSEKSIKKLLNYLRTKNIVIKVLINNATPSAMGNIPPTIAEEKNFFSLFIIPIDFPCMILFLSHLLSIPCNKA